MMNKLAFLLAAHLLLVHAGHAADPKDQALSQKEAVALAEAFVAAQGYTGAAVAPGKDLALEPGEQGRAPAEVFNSRKGTLQPASIGARLESDMWFVGFRSTNLQRIRGIVVNAKTRKIKMVSQNLQLAWLTSPVEEKTTAKGSSNEPAATTPAEKPKPASKQKGKKAAAKAAP